MKKLCRLLTKNPANSAGVTAMLLLLLVMLLLMGSTVGYGTAALIILAAVIITVAIVGTLFGLITLFENMKEWCADE